MYSIDYDTNIVTEPASEPVSLAQARLWLKIPDNITTDDTIITSLIKYARRYVERYTKRALFTQTWDLISSYSPSMVELPKGQLQSITSVIIVSEDGTETTQSTDLYHTTLGGDNGKLWLSEGSSWGTTTRDFDSFKVRFVCGWDDVDDIPENFITAMKDIITYKYENRGFTDKDAYLLCQQNAVGRLY